MNTLTDIDAYEAAAQAHDARVTVYFDKAWVQFTVGRGYSSAIVFVSGMGRKSFHSATDAIEWIEACNAAAAMVSA